MPLDEVRSRRIIEPCPGTGDWFLTGESFKSWRDARRSSLLWIEGSPGQGKSTLAKIALKHLENGFPGRNCAVIYFFCFQQEEKLRRATDILRALIIQLIDCQELFQCLPTKYIEDDSKFSTAPLANLWDLFQKLASKFGDRCIYCVIDALDECSKDNEQRSELVRNIADLVSTERMHVKFLLTSRPGEQDINAGLQKFPTLELQARIEDLKAVINSEVEKLPSHSFDDERKKEIEKELLAQAGTTFLWVSIVIKQITGLKFPSMREVRRIFAENPKDLDELYEKLFSRIIATDTPQKTCEKLLYWVAYSEQPLSVEGLDDAIMCDPELGEYKTLSERDDDRRSINKQMIREHLGTLLKVERTRYVGQELVYLNHQSVYDYFRGIRAKAFNGEIDLYFARTCIWYLNAEEFGQPAPKPKTHVYHEWDSFAAMRRGSVFSKIEKPYHFLRYACSQWHKHIKTTVDAKSEWKRIQNLLDCEQSLLEIWAGGLEIWAAGLLYPNLLTGLAVYMDIPWLTELILSGDFGAAKFEEGQIGQMFVKAPKSFKCFSRVHGGKISASSNIMNAVAKRSSRIQWTDTLSDIGASDIKITEALMVAAAENCDESVLRLFLTDRGNHIKITERILISAASNPNKDAMRLLLTDRRIEIKITEQILISAASNPNRGVMRLLLTDREIEITEGILISAARNFDKDVIQLLLTDRGNDIKITEQVLIYAVRNPNKGAMRLLLTDRRIEIKITEQILISAASNPNRGVMRLLLTDREIEITEGILISAARNFDKDVIQLLLTDRGNDIKITEQVLIYAVRNPNKGAMRLLLTDRRIEIKITEQILISAAQMNLSRMTFLLDHGGSAIRITEPIVKAAAGNGKLQRFLLERQSRGCAIRKRRSTRSRSPGRPWKDEDYRREDEKGDTTGTES